MYNREACWDDISGTGNFIWYSCMACNDYYTRRIRVGKNESMYKYLSENHPELVEDEFFRPHDTAVISIPQKAPKGSILRGESPFDLFERIKKVAQEWIKYLVIEKDLTLTMFQLLLV